MNKIEVKWFFSLFWICFLNLTVAVAPSYGMFAPKRNNLTANDYLSGGPENDSGGADDSEEHIRADPSENLISPTQVEELFARLDVLVIPRANPFDVTKAITCPNNEIPSSNLSETPLSPSHSDALPSYVYDDRSESTSPVTICSESSFTKGHMVLPWLGRKSPDTTPQNSPGGASRYVVASCAHCGEKLGDEGLALSFSLSCQLRYTCPDCLIAHVHMMLWIDNIIPYCPCCRTDYSEQEVEAISKDERYVTRFRELRAAKDRYKADPAVNGMPSLMPTFRCRNCQNGTLKPHILGNHEAVDQCSRCEAVFLFKEADGFIKCEQIAMDESGAEGGVDSASDTSSESGIGTASDMTSESGDSLATEMADLSLFEGSLPATAAPLPKPEPIRQIFVDMAACQPDAMALEDVFDYGAQNCEICFDQLTKADHGYLATLPCREHWVCQACYKEHIVHCVRDKKLPSCPACDIELDTVDMEMITGSKDMEKQYNDFLLEQLIMTDPSFFTCTKPGCGMYAFRPVLKEGQTEDVNCSKCMTQYHFYGKKHSRYAQLLDKAAEKEQLENYKVIAEQVRQGNMKLCPKCKTAIERTYGCAHMTCQQCKHHFCWVCQNSWGLAGYTTHAMCSTSTGYSPFRIKVVTMPSFNPESEERKKCRLM
ncbi:IBR domain-containing protein [Sansalvadorimonas sp. 2012CJ34-2]|uniref:RBR-type E3 ubiquitin transferase n=1 Tax=Parendozoicomonas callyspongiae TaxID=2942213 RepID=A0ABT0PBE7_9GAMM|nr:IBR domain-containing protein [Sansalvadorimonas sp. 2012CJ34-2]MCL6268710.1 IBR domain-containing protein [Sansalvadorimonas sp. 2012CJ34-2]